MTVFKVYLKILNRYKFSVILYTVLLVAFAAINNQSRTQQSMYEASLPTIAIEDLDRSDLSKEFVKYMDSKTEIIEIDAQQRKDALFYRQLDFVLTIPKGFEKDTMAQNVPEIAIEKSGDFSSYYANMIMEQFLQATQRLAKVDTKVEDLIRDVNASLKTETKVYMESKLNHSSLNALTSYYNFSTYSLLAGVLYIIGLTMTSFKKEEIKKRLLVSSTKESSIQTQLWICNIGYALVLWSLYVLISYFICGDVLLSTHGLYYIMNSFVYLICVTTMAFFISTFVQTREAVNGIVNVLGLGSAFLCGAFIPVNLLPKFVLKIARVLPAYWFIQSNETIRTIEVFSNTNVQVIYSNAMVMALFALGFFILTILSSTLKRKM
ncbi:MAG: ABC transporter permease [Bacillota bacterium]|nr:ABC transporter permease [Bacillota bacterium]